jgi:hypothetical protein
MKKQSRKLTLDRETLLPMTSQELAGANGGTSPATTVTTSSGACISAASAVSAASITTVSMAVCESRWCGHK